MADYEWIHEIDAVDWDELSDLYRVAPLGIKPPEALRTVFGNSMFRCFAYADGRLVGAGRALADGLDCAYIGDVAVHPDEQGRGLGKEIIRRLVEQAERTQEDHPLREPGQGGLLPQARIPPDEDRDGDVAGPGRCDRRRRAG